MRRPVGNYVYAVAVYAYLIGMTYLLVRLIVWAVTRG